MTTTPHLIDRMADRCGRDPADVRLRGRYLREAGMLPAAPTGRKARRQLPQIDAVHAAAILLANMSRAPQLHAPAEVRSLWWAPLTRRERPSSQIGTGEPLPFETTVCLGEAIVSLIERAVAGIEEAEASPDYAHGMGVPSFTSSDRHICLMPDGAVYVRDGEVIDIFCSVARAVGLATTANKSAIISSTYATSWLLLDLADFVYMCRRHAIELGVKINSEQALRALQYAHPLPRPMPARASRTKWNTEAKTIGPAPTNASPEMTEPAGAPPPTGSEIGQQATQKAPASPDKVQTNLSPEVSATPESRAGRSQTEAPTKGTARSPLARRFLQNDDARQDRACYATA